MTQRVELGGLRLPAKHHRPTRACQQLPAHLLGKSAGGLGKSGFAEIGPEAVGNQPSDLANQFRRQRQTKICRGSGRSPCRLDDIEPLPMVRPAARREGARDMQLVGPVAQRVGIEHQRDIGFRPAGMAVTSRPKAS